MIAAIITILLVTKEVARPAVKPKVVTSPSSEPKTISLKDFPISSSFVCFMFSPI